MFMIPSAQMSQNMRHRLELRTRGGDIAVLYWHKAATYGQTRVFEILQYVASQSASRPQPSQQQQQSAGARRPPNARIRQPAATSQQQPIQPSHTCSTGATQQQQEPPQDTAVPPPKPPTESASNAQATTAVLPASESTTQYSHSEAEAMQIEPESSATKGKANPPTEKATVMEEAIRVTG